MWGCRKSRSSAGVAKPTLYHFFGSKQGILEAIFAERVSVLDALVSKAAVYSGDLPRTLDNIAAAYIEFATSEPAAYRLELGLYFAPRENPARSVAVRHFALSAGAVGGRVYGRCERSREYAGAASEICSFASRSAQQLHRPAIGRRDHDYGSAASRHCPSIQSRDLLGNSTNRNAGDFQASRSLIY